MRRSSILVPLLALALVFGPSASALPTQGRQDLTPLGSARGGGWISGVQANGSVYSIGVVHLAGALPDTTYTVVRKVHSAGVGSCSSFFANFTLPFGTLTTGASGNATASTQLASAAVDQYPFLHGLTVGQIVEVYGPGNVLSYRTSCVEFTMH